MKENYKLYNVIFPIWIVVFMPPVVILVVIVNTIIDFLVTFIAMKKLEIQDAYKRTKRVLLKIVVTGFLADFVGAAFLFGMSYVISMIGIKLKNEYFDNTAEALMGSGDFDLLSIVIFAIAILIAGGLIYIINMKYSFKNLDIEVGKKKKIALSLAILTAPYTYLIPVMWFV